MNYNKRSFDPWKQVSYDRYDTVLMDPATDANLGDFFARLEEDAWSPTWHEEYSAGTTDQQDAAEKTEAHVDTPARVYFDSLGRPFIMRADNGDEKYHITHTLLDIEGNALRVTVFRETDTTSPVALDVMTTDYDVAGRPIRTVSPDAGTRILFPDIAGNPIHTWDSRDHHFQVVYDVLRRPVET